MNNRLSRTYIVNPDVARKLVRGSGFTIEELAANSHLGIGKKTIRKILRGEPVYMSSVRALGEFFGEDVAALLEHDGLQAEKPAASIGDWDILRPLGPVEETPNKLQFRRYQLVHRHEPQLLARGKRFVLDHLSLADRTRVQEHLLRHTNVCNQVGPHPNLARHLEIKSDVGEDLWWVIDQWIEGESMEHCLARGPLARSLLPGVMEQVAMGLDVLHRHGVLMRHLTPRTIILQSGTTKPVLVDFEMAKLNGRRPTVSPQQDWPDDAYRAPEIGGTGKADPRADAYSWARILLHALTGQVPPPAQRAVKVLRECAIPAAINNVAAECLSPNREQRPANMRQVIRAVKRWK